MFVAPGPDDKPPRGAIPFIVLVVLIVIAILGKVAFGAPPPGSDPNSPRAQWFRSLKQNGTDISCCGISDCRPVDYRIKDNSYEVLWEKRWVKIPDEKVIKRENPTGEAIWCHSNGFIDGEGHVSEPMTFCFVPPDLT